MKLLNRLVASTILLLLIACNPEQKKENSDSEKDYLVSWNDSESKQKIIAFVTKVVDKESNLFVDQKDRIAVFDNDGTLWTERPAYFQFIFALDRLKELKAAHPEWNENPPYEWVLLDINELKSNLGVKELLELITLTHAGMSTEEFDQIVKKWFENSTHPRFEKPYSELVYQPMLELLDYLRANGFKTYIVSGGGIDFMRPVLSEVYGIPNEQIIGSTYKSRYEYNNGDPRIMKEGELFFIDDKEGKPENIQRIIGKKPIFCGGNSDGDLAMMQWTASNSVASHMLYIHHTDSIREWAYDRNSHIGKLDIGLDEALKKGWNIIDMENDWKKVYPWED